MKEGGCYRGGAGVGERDGFGPAGEAIDDCEEMVVYIYIYIYIYVEEIRRIFRA